MEANRLIAIDEFCPRHDIELSFISLLDQNGLITISTIQETGYIDAEQIRQIEKIIRFYYDLDINLEGIETINHLLQRIAFLQEENISLKNRLRLYESNR